MSGVCRAWRGKNELLWVEGLLVPSLALDVVAQIAIVTRRTFAERHIVSPLRPSLDQEALLMVTHTIVTFQVDYCNVFHIGLTLKSILKLHTGTICNDMGGCGCFSSSTCYTFAL